MKEYSTTAPLPPPCTDARHEGVGEPLPREASWRPRRPQPSQRSETERGDPRRDLPWRTGSPHSSAPRDHRGHTVNTDGWRRNGDVEHYTSVLPRAPDNEPLSLSSQIHSRDSRIQTGDDQRIAHCTAMHAELTAENDRLKSENVNLIADKREQEATVAELKASVGEKDKQMDSMKKELSRMRVVLYREFQLDAFGPNVPSVDETDDPTDPVPPAAAVVPVPNDERSGDSAYLSPRSACHSRHSPPPLRSGSCYSPLPNHTTSPRAASPQRSTTDARGPNDRSLQSNVVPLPHHAGQEAIANPRGNAGLPPSPAQGVTSQAHSCMSYPPVPPAVLPYAHGHPHMWSPAVPATHVNASLPLSVSYSTLPQRPVMPPSVSGVSAPPATAPVHAVAEQMAIVGGLYEKKNSPTVRFFRSSSKSSRVNWHRFCSRSMSLMRTEGRGRKSWTFEMVCLSWNQSSISQHR